MGEVFWKSIADKVVAGTPSTGEPASYYDILFKPMQLNYHVVLGSCLLFFALEWGFHALSLAFSPAYRRLKPGEKDDWTVCLISIVHAVVTWATIPGGIWPGPDLLEGGHYAFSSVSQFFYGISAGYFLWDMFISFYKGWGIPFKIHAIVSFGIFYFSLHPFLHYWGRFFQGIFEISTPWLHLRTILVLAQMNGTWQLRIVETLFAILFTIVRVVMGSVMSYLWWGEMIVLIRSDKQHSRIIIAFMLFANAVLMSLQLYWFRHVINALAGEVASPPGGSTYDEDTSKEEEKKKEK